MSLRSNDPRPGAEQFVPDTADLGEVARAVQECRGCELYRDATQAVFGRGGKHARMLLLGEQPGDSEDRRGEPFVGPAGKLLRRALEQAGIDEKDAYITNAAGQALFGPPFRVGAARGSVQEWSAPYADEGTASATDPMRLPVVATVHPSAVLRAPDRDEALDGLVEDLRAAGQLLES